MSENVEEMSLIDIIRKAPGSKERKKAVEPKVPQEAGPEVPPSRPEKEVPEKPPKVREPEGVAVSELATPEPDPTWGWEQVQEHENQILESAFSMLKSTLQEHEIEFKECTNNQPYTLMVGELTVQNIMLPWDTDPRVTVFKGIRVICPKHLDKRVDAFRRRRKKGPFNFRGLVERIKLRSREVTQDREKKQQQEELETRLRTYQEKELGGVPMPSGLTLSRNEDGSYDGTLTFYNLSLAATKHLMKFGNKIESR